VSKVSDVELLHQLIEDVKLLDQTIGTAGLDGSAVRSFFSPMLRKWSEPTGIYSVQKIIGQKVTFPCRDHKLMVRACEQRKMVDWASPLGKEGVEFSTSLPCLSLQQPQSVKIAVDEPMAITQLDSASFFNQKLMFLKNEFLTRAEIINYVANRMGGAHSVPNSKKDTDLKFERFKQLLGYSYNGLNIQLLMGPDLENTRKLEQDGTKAVDPFTSYVSDSTSRFVNGIKEKMDILNRRLNQLKFENQ
jgi:hypothetical protein